MKTKEDIQHTLSRGGYQQSDINLGSLLSKRMYQSRLALTHNITICNECYVMGEMNHRPVTGTGPINSPLMIISTMPEQEESDTTVPFIGTQGQMLAILLSKANVDINSIYCTYAVKVPLNHSPKPSELQHARHHFLEEIEAVNPGVVLTFGTGAMMMVQNTFDLSISDMRGKSFELSCATPAGFTKTIQAYHTYGIDKLYQPGENLSAFKTAIWNDTKRALDHVRQIKPNYTYDRVGLNTL